jgi:hypothetical protein
LPTLLREDPVRSKAALARHIGQLKLIPKETEKGPVYEVNGSLELLPPPNASDVMPLVARDGIEKHYTFVGIPLNGVLLDSRLDLKEAQRL